MRVSAEEKNNRITEKGLASLEFTMQWESVHAAHTDTYFARKVTFWRDILPEKIYQRFLGARHGDIFEFSARRGQIVPEFDPGYEFPITLNQFDRQYFPSAIIEPRIGRFYPKGMLKALPGIFRGNVSPFRCVGMRDQEIFIDFNHPLAAKDIRLTVLVRDVRGKAGELGGSCTDWMDTITDGPGMQARWKDSPSDFFSDEPFRRNNEDSDSAFYENPRLVAHLDQQAISVISSLYGFFLRNGMNVLDLMSSYMSHIPEYLELDALTGLGLNDKEMSLNLRLTGHVVHNLNIVQDLPFSDNLFDAVICTVSVEYLTSPFRVFESVARVLKPGGYFIVTFSNRWFPPKVVRIWTEIHEFERVGLVTEYFLRSGKFMKIGTYSMRGLPRPEDDRHYPGIMVSDPVFAVWGQKS